MIVNFGLAKLAKAKGFDGVTDYVYTGEGEKRLQFGAINYPPDLFPDYVAAPTVTELRNWIISLGYAVLPQFDTFQEYYKYIIWRKSEGEEPFLYCVSEKEYETIEEAVQEGMSKILKDL